MIKQTTLRNNISTLFSLSELQSLCFDLDISFESIEGDTIEAKTIGLINYCKRHNCLSELQDIVKKLRPSANWGSHSQDNSEKVNNTPPQQVTISLENNTIGDGNVIGVGNNSRFNSKK